MSAPQQYPAELMAGQWTPRRAAVRPAPVPPVKQRPRPDPRSLAARLLTVSEIATALRVSKMTVYRLIHDPDSGLSAIRVGRSLRVPLANLRAYVERNRLGVDLDDVQDEL